MGMYDTINETLFCPYCGKKQEKNSFQSKDLSSWLSGWTFEQIIKVFDEYDDTNKEFEFHTFCKDCNKFVSINLKLREIVRWFHEKRIKQIKKYLKIK